MLGEKLRCIIIIQTTHGIFVVIVWWCNNPPRNIGEGFIF